MCWLLIDSRFIVITASAMILRQVLVLPAMLLMGVVLVLIIVALVVVILVIGICCLGLVAIAIIILATLRMSRHDGEIVDALQYPRYRKRGIFQKSRILVVSLGSGYRL